MSDARDIRPLPKTVALIEFGDRTSALPGLLLDDFEDALGVYARIGGVPSPRRVLASRHADALVIATHARDMREARYTAIAPGALVYALIACDACETSEARQALESLEERLDRTHATLAGCALIPLAETLETRMRGPRMGHARRNVSEATDELVLALRCADEAGIIDVRPPWPRALCHLLASRRR